MKAKRTKTSDRKLIEANIKDVWSSLLSHLEWTYKRSSEGKRFHVKCVRDYAQQIERLSKLL